MPTERQPAIHPVREFVVRVLSLTEDVVYAGLGVLLALAAAVLLYFSFKSFLNAIFAGKLDGLAVSLLEQVLLVLLIVELLYTVQVSFREHGLLAEPFLVVALIAVIRRILVVTAEVPKLPEAGEAVFRRAIFELSLLALMIVVLVGSLIMLQKQARRQPAARQ